MDYFIELIFLFCLIMVPFVTKPIIVAIDLIDSYFYERNIDVFTTITINAIIKAYPDLGQYPNSPILISELNEFCEMNIMPNDKCIEIILDMLWFQHYIVEVCQAEANELEAIELGY